MRRLLAVTTLLVLLGSTAWADKVKTKNKEKRFEPVVLSAAESVGSYRGPSDEYELVLELALDGTLRGTYTELGRIAVLDAFDFDGADFTARARFDDGASETFRGSFARRVLNGVPAFGVRVYGVPVAGFGEIDTFFEVED